MLQEFLILQHTFSFNKRINRLKTRNATLNSFFDKRNDSFKIMSSYQLQSLKIVYFVNEVYGSIFPVIKNNRVKRQSEIFMIDL